MEIEKYFTAETIEIIKKAISDAEGREVFFTGILNEKGIVHEVKIGSRGNEHSVPVNFSDLQSADVLIHNHPSGFLNPSEEDIGVASNASYNGAGFYIINKPFCLYYTYTLAQYIHTSTG
jgi:ATP-dependent DNA helicase DinG